MRLERLEDRLPLSHAAGDLDDPRPLSPSPFENTPRLVTRPVDYRLPNTSAVYTAALPDGAAVGNLAQDLAASSSSTPAVSFDPLEDVSRWIAPTVLGETEPNDTIAGSEVISLGFDPGEENKIDIFAELTDVDISTTIVQSEDDGSISRATDTGLEPGSSVLALATIGDGLFGDTSGDIDLYRVTASAGAKISIAINTESIGSSLDPLVGIYDSNGAFWNGSASSTASFMVPADDTYYIVVVGFGPGFPNNLTDSESGRGVGSTGPYEIVIGLSTEDVDFYTVELEAGDILGARIHGAARHLVLRDAGGAKLVGSEQDLSFMYPDASPLPRGGTASLAWVVDTSGPYTLAVDEGRGRYGLSLRLFRPVLESQPRGTHQILFLDFDGATISGSTFGQPFNPTLSPLVSFLRGWGLERADESAVIDAILATVEENFADVARLGNNGDFFADDTDGHFGIEILNSRDHPDPWGLPNVSRVIVGGSFLEFGFSVIGLAESIDVGNFDTQETGVVLLDLFTGTGSPLDSLNRIDLDPEVSKIDLVGIGVGNFVAHEAGHFFANFHTLQSGTLNLMDLASVPNMAGIGRNEIFEGGAGDDIDVDFGRDSYVQGEGLTGQQDTLNAIAFGLSTGTQNVGMAVMRAAPGNNDTVLSLPTQFVVDVFDPYDPASVDASDLTVNGIVPDSVWLTDPNTITFQYIKSPVSADGPQTMIIAAGAIARVDDGQPIEAYHATFGYDSLSMRVTSITPFDGSTIAPAQSTGDLRFATVRLRLNETYEPSSLDMGDLVLSRGIVTNATAVDAKTVQFEIGFREDNGFLQGEGPLELELPAGALRDVFDNPSLVFTATFEVDDGRTPRPTGVDAKPDITFRSRGRANVSDPIVEVDPAGPWHNAANPWDVNGDSYISPIDLLLVINHVNNDGSHQSAEPAAGETGKRLYLDVNGDSFVSPIDLLYMINYLRDPTGTPQLAAMPHSLGESRAEPAEGESTAGTRGHESHGDDRTETPPSDRWAHAAVFDWIARRRRDKSPLFVAAGEDKTPATVGEDLLIGVDEQLLQELAARQ